MRLCDVEMCEHRFVFRHFFQALICMNTWFIMICILSLAKIMLWFIKKAILFLHMRSFLHRKRQQINSALFVMQACKPKYIK